MPQNRTCLLVNGKSRTGKSYFVKNSVIPEIKEKKPVVIFDRLGEYAGKRAEDVPQKWESHRSVFAFFGALKEDHGGTLEGVHVIKCMNDSDYVYGLQFLKKLQSPVFIVLDEAHDIYKAKELKKAGEVATQLVRYGGHYGVDFVMISQRTKDTPPDFRSQQTGVISFQQSSGSDVKALKEMGYDAAEKVLDLDKRKFKVFGEVPKTIKANV